MEMSEDRGDTWEEVIERMAEAVEEDHAFDGPAIRKGGQLHERCICGWKGSSEYGGTWLPHFLGVALAAALAPPTKTCDLCDGTGKGTLDGTRQDWLTCGECNGSGRVPAVDAPRLAMVTQVGERWTNRNDSWFSVNPDAYSVACWRDSYPEVRSEPVFIEVVPEESRASDGGNDHE